MNILVKVPARFITSLGFFEVGFFKNTLQYKVPTKIAPPIMLPSVTGIMFLNIKELQFRFAKTETAPTGSVPKAGATADKTEAWLFKKIPAGIKNILAILCSNPQATKAVIGNTIQRILLTPSLLALANHTARQTSQLQSCLLYTSRCV